MDEAKEIRRIIRSGIFCRRMKIKVYCLYEDYCPYQSFRKINGKRVCLWSGLCNQQSVDGNIPDSFIPL